MANTVKVRIAVAVDENGDWAAFGTSADSDSNMMCTAREDAPGSREWESLFWLEAELPIPEIQTIQAKVSE